MADAAGMSLLAAAPEEQEEDEEDVEKDATGDGCGPDMILAKRYSNFLNGGGCARPPSAEIPVAGWEEGDDDGEADNGDDVHDYRGAFDDDEDDG